MLDAGFTCCFGDFPDSCVPWFLVWERIEKKKATFSKKNSEIAFKPCSQLVEIGDRMYLDH